jgi:hypothetical protein
MAVTFYSSGMYPCNLCFSPSVGQFSTLIQQLIAITSLYGANITNKNLMTKFLLSICEIFQMLNISPSSEKPTLHIHGQNKKSLFLLKKSSNIKQLMSHLLNVINIGQCDLRKQ